jgi:hypothetical protein
MNVSSPYQRNFQRPNTLDIGNRARNVESSSKVHDFHLLLHRSVTAAAERAIARTNAKQTLTVRVYL